jgi:V/A-type H+-transporting ATPase subunit D
MNISASAPTRAGRLRLVARLGVARHAADLLRSKEEVLDRERSRLEGHTARAEADWRQRSQEAATWLVRARTLGASDEISAAIEQSGQPATVMPRWQTSMGIVYPGSVESTPGSTAELASTAALGPTIEAYRSALAAGATYAATTAAVNRLDAELAATRRRRRAIEDRLQPRLEAALHQLDIHLDELDREEALRVHVAIELQEVNQPC